MQSYKVNNYDDFDRAVLEGEDISSGLFSPFTLIVITLVLVLFGLFMMYSASYDEAVTSGYNHYYYFIWQLIGVVSGVLLALLMRFIPMKWMEKSYFLFCPLAAAVNILMFFPSFRDGSFFAINGLRLFTVQSIDALAIITLISGTISPIIKMKERNGIYFSLVALVVTFFVVTSALVGGAGSAFLLILVLTLMMYSSGSKRRYAVFSFLFLTVTVLFILFVSPRIFHDTAFSLYPVHDAELYNESLLNSRLAINDGALVGNGVGRGLYKLGQIQGIKSEYIFASVAEEIGLLGIVFVFVLYLLFVLIGTRTAGRAYRKENFPVAGACVGFVSFIALEAILSALYTAGYFPFPGLIMPFFSYSPGDEAVFVFIALLLYRYVYAIGRPSNGK